MALTVLLAALAVRLVSKTVQPKKKIVSAPITVCRMVRHHHPPSGLRHRFLSGNVAYLSGLFTGFGRGFAFAGRAG